MARVVRILVVDDKGYGVSGIRVHEYNGDNVRTNSEGIATLTLEGSSTTIYVNGFTAYDGSVSRLNATERFTKTGKRL